jgi:hypothetical protein
MGSGKWEPDVLYVNAMSIVHPLLVFHLDLDTFKMERLVLSRHSSIVGGRMVDLPKASVLFGMEVA